MILVSLLLMTSQEAIIAVFCGLTKLLHTENFIWSGFFSASIIELEKSMYFPVGSY